MKILPNQSIVVVNSSQEKQDTIQNIEEVKDISLENLPEKRDLVSFKALTKAKLKGFDLVMVEKVKAPIQNFRDYEHLQRWAGTRFLSLGFEKIKSRTRHGLMQKNVILKEWYKYLESGNDAYSNTLKFVIYSSLLAGLSAEDDKLPPNLNKGVLADTIVEIENQLAVNPKAQFNFNKVYINNLKKSELKDEKTVVNDVGTGWVIIPSYKNDPANFKSNVKKLQNLSHENWCTKSLNAQPYLKNGDFHVYLENGKPKLGVRFDGDNVVEIQGEKNNSKFPREYYEVFKTHQQEYNLSLTKQAANEVGHIEKVEPLIKKIKEELGEVIEIKSVEDAERILDYFGVKHERTAGDSLVIPNYSKIGFNGVFLSDIGCKEESLWKYIAKIEGDADFSGCNLDPFETLTEIGGNVILDEYATISDLGTLKKIGGDLVIKECYLESLGDLEYIGGNITNKSEYLKSTNNVKIVGGNIDFSDFETVDNLEKVGGDVKIRGPRVEHLGKLKRVDGDVEICDAYLSGLENLESIGGKLLIDNSEIGSLENLKRVDGDVDFIDSKFENFGDLESVGGDMMIQGCSKIGFVIRESNLKEIDGDVSIEDSSATEFDFEDININGELRFDGELADFLKDIKL